MRWKRNSKRSFDEFSKNIFEFSDDESSIILWPRSNQSPNTLSADFLNEAKNEYESKTKNIIKNLNDKFYLNKFTYIFSSIGISEYFDFYLSGSEFENTFNYFKTQKDTYIAKLILLMIWKWNYYTIEKFSVIYNFSFPPGKELSVNSKRKVFEAMRETNLESIDKMLNYVNEILDDFSTLDPYKNFLLIEEIIDLGEEYTWHWSKMLDQIVDIAIDSFYNEAPEENYNSYDTIDFDSSFDDFYEKTKTMVVQDELDEAFKYFEINFSTPESEFKKIYRRLAKIYHPDINKSPEAQIEMKKINVYKTIIEDYYNFAN